MSEDEQIATTRERLKALRENIEDQELERSLLALQVQSLEAEIQDIRSSMSWRITAPLRHISASARAMVTLFRQRNTAKVEARHECSVVVPLEHVPEKLPEEDTFVLYRIIGNDLPPRHNRGQSLRNVRFILQHEPKFTNCEKRFILNRIVDKDAEREIALLLSRSGYEYTVIPFDPAEYRKIGAEVDACRPSICSSPHFVRGLDEELRARWEMALYQNKNRYVMNVNGARNLALAESRSRAKWIMPWDGNCFMTQGAWDQLTADVAAQPACKYFVVPMARVVDNEYLTGCGVTPSPNDEPQVMFRADSTERFDPGLYYGHHDKAELLWRLGVHGAWGSYVEDPWDPARRPVSSDAGLVGRAGWVARLFSGKHSLEGGSDRAKRYRALARAMGVLAALRRLDKELDVNSISAASAGVLEKKQ